MGALCVSLMCTSVAAQSELLVPDSDQAALFESFEGIIEKKAQKCLRSMTPLYYRSLNTGRSGACDDPHTLTWIQYSVGAVPSTGNPDDSADGTDQDTVTATIMTSNDYPPIVVDLSSTQGLAVPTSSSWKALNDTEAKAYEYLKPLLEVRTEKKYVVFVPVSISAAYYLNGAPGYHRDIEVKVNDTAGETIVINTIESSTHLDLTDVKLKYSTDTYFASLCGTPSVSWLNTHEQMSALNAEEGTQILELAISQHNEFKALVMKPKVTTGTGGNSDPNAATSHKIPVAFSFAGNEWVWAPALGDIGGSSSLANLSSRLTRIIYPPPATTGARQICCDGDGDGQTQTQCRLPIPSTNNDDDRHEFVVETYVSEEADDVSNEQRAARFLITATFGPTPAELQGLTTSLDSTSTTTGAAAAAAGQNAFHQWITDQIELPLTSHRAYYRRRANPRVVEATKNQRLGSLHLPCSIGSRWHEFTFLDHHIGQTLTVTYDAAAENGAGVSTVSLLDLSGSTIKTELLTDVKGKDLREMNGKKICLVRQGVTARVAVESDSGKCNKVFPGGNPPLWFTAESERHKEVHSFEASDMTLEALGEGIPQTGSYYMTELKTPCPYSYSDSSSSDSAVAAAMIPNVYLKRKDHPWNGQVMKFDARLRLLENSFTSPAADDEISDTHMCVTAPKTQFNREHCQQRKSCSALTSSNFLPVDVQLDKETLRSFKTEGRKFVYYVSNLRLLEAAKGSPCSTSGAIVSRWFRVSSNNACSTPASLPSATASFLRAAIASSSDTANPYVRDVRFSKAATPTQCDESATAPSSQGEGIHITVGGSECWKHVHPNEYDVVDATAWAGQHPGGQQAITQFADAGDVELPFPSSHGMHRWDEKSRWLPVLGRYGDTVPFTKLPKSVQTQDLAIFFKANQPYDGASNTLTCGSPNEVANEPARDHMYKMDVTEDRYTSGVYGAFGKMAQMQEHKGSVWTNVVLTAADQLRQRVAWALAQIVVVSRIGLVGLKDSSFKTEPFVHFYDIFVRHAFGSYRDVLREVSYSPMMGWYLSFVNNKALAVSGAAPDENYAREIMQLFSIGLYKLNEDGTLQTDKEGKSIPTYDIQHIENFARVWTGFKTQAPRANLEFTNKNAIDPMYIDAQWRDWLPKRDLYGEYLGDTYYPLCSDVLLPPSGGKAFLRKGAVYRYLGDKGTPEGMPEDEREGTTPAKKRLTVQGLFGSSGLGRKLCGGLNPADFSCNFPSEVILDETVECDGDLCHTDTLRTIKVETVVSGVTTHVFYEYIQPPCVELTFIAAGKYVQYRAAKKSRMCADPNSLSAGAACHVDATKECRWACSYFQEHMTFAQAQAMCARSPNTDLCRGNALDSKGQECAEDNTLLYRNWVDQDCTMSVDVDDSGKVALWASGSHEVLQMKGTRFAVGWEDGKWPTKLACPTGCTAQTTTCKCPITVKDSAVYNDFAKLPASKEEVMRALKIGGAAPDTAYFREYTGHEVPEGVKLWSRKESSKLDATAVFEISDHGRPNGKTIYLQNRVSMVSIEGGTESFRFRNPPKFMRFTDPTRRDAEYETEALLDQLFYHSSTAPFVAKHLIAKFVASNPSPRYVGAVVRAFKTGTYGGKTYSGQYGDLGAAVAATLLEDDSISPVMEVSPFHGKLREPLIEIMHTMRSLSAVPRLGQEIQFTNLLGDIGQNAYSSPSVFNFFDAAHQPFGPLGEVGLVAPEAELLTTPRFIDYLNGMRSLVRNRGVTNCFDGWGHGTAKQTYNFKRNCATKDDQCVKTTDTKFNFDSVPIADGVASATVDRLSMLLTGGRLNRFNRDVIVDAYNTWEKSNGAEDALTAALVLLTAAPEFHTTNKNSRTELPRPAPETPVRHGHEYKAVVVVTMKGGADTFGALVPQTCSEDLYARWAGMRRELALNKTDLLTINARDQPCTQFGLHPSMSHLRDRYLTKDALIFANTGNLVEPVTATEFGKGKEVPDQLFSHNSQTLQSQTVNAGTGKAGSDGVFGRIVKILNGQETHKVHASAFSASDGVNPTIFKGEKAPTVATTKGYRAKDKYGADIDRMNGIMSGSLFAETYASRQAEAIAGADAVAKVLLNDAYATQAAFDLDDKLQKQLDIVATVIRGREEAAVKTERHFFFVDIGGWDTHGDNSETTGLYQQVDVAMKVFQEELVAQGMWDNVAIVGISEFGRTMTSNGNSGTDHGWGGNYWMMGGSVKGGHVLGHYPDRLDNSDLHMLSRGRFVPTTPWESIWHGVGEWMGVAEYSMEQLFPNMKNFPAETMFTQRQLFTGKYEDPAPKPTTDPTPEPTHEPTVEPTHAPTQEPTVVPTGAPSAEPTVDSTEEPADSTSSIPTAEPTSVPTQEQTLTPSDESTSEPFEVDPTEAEPTEAPTVEPTAPTEAPTVEPTVEPTETPTDEPTGEPTAVPTVEPTAEPTETPAVESTVTPTEIPTHVPTVTPTGTPTDVPTMPPSETTKEPSGKPTAVPSAEPTDEPPVHTETPTSEPTAQTTSVPTTNPTVIPTETPHPLAGMPPTNPPTLTLDEAINMTYFTVTVTTQGVAVGDFSSFMDSPDNTQLLQYSLEQDLTAAIQQYGLPGAGGRREEVADDSEWSVRVTRVTGTATGIDYDADVTKHIQVGEFAAGSQPSMALQNALSAQALTEMKTLFGSGGSSGDSGKSAGGIAETLQFTSVSAAYRQATGDEQAPVFIFVGTTVDESSVKTSVSEIIMTPDASELPAGAGEQQEQPTAENTPYPQTQQITMNETGGRSEDGGRLLFQASSALPVQTKIIKCSIFVLLLISSFTLVHG